MAGVLHWPGRPMAMGKQEHFGVLYETHSSYVRAIARRLLKDTAAVEDVVQDVFLQAWGQLDRYDPERGDLRAWLTVITRSRALDRLRSKTRWQHTGGTDALEAPDPEQRDPSRLAELTEGMSRIRGAWASLPAGTRQIFELAYEDNLSQRQIALRLGETLGVVKSRLRQGLAALQAHAKDRDSAGVPSQHAEWALTTTIPCDLPDSSHELPSLQGVCVMVVDDDAATREVLGALLTRAGASPTLRRSAAEACRALRETWPDVLLSDIGMPEQDGYSLIMRVQTMASRTGRYLAAIAFTARATEWDRTRALRAGFTMYLSKPVHPIAVLTAIRRVADRRQPAISSS